MVVRDAKRAAILFFDLYASFFCVGGEGCCRTGRTSLTGRTGLTFRTYRPGNEKEKTSVSKSSLGG